MNPQMTKRVRGKDGKKYLISTMQYRKTDAGELWETAVFEGGGFVTPAKKQRYSAWMVFPEGAPAAQADLERRVQNELPEVWAMTSEFIEEVRESAAQMFLSREALHDYESSNAPSSKDDESSKT